MACADNSYQVVQLLHVPVGQVSLRTFLEFLVDRTALSLIGYWHRSVVSSSVCLSICASVCNAVHCGAQGRCRELKVVPSFS